MNEFDAVALDLITEFGGTGQYIEVAAGSYDPATAQPVRMTSSYTVPAVLFDLTLQSNGLSVKYGTQIIAGDKEAYVVPPLKAGSGPAITPDPVNDKFIFGGVTYTIVTYKEINPTGTDPIVFFLYLRR